MRCLSCRSDSSLRWLTSSGCPAMITDTSLSSSVSMFASKPNLLEQIRRQALRLVDDEHGRLVAIPPASQQRLELQQQAVFDSLGLVRQLEARREHVARTRHASASGCAGARSARAAAGARAPPGSSWSCPTRPRRCSSVMPLRAGDAVFEIAQRLPMRVRQDQEPRVRRQIERPSVEAEKIFVHRILTARTCRSGSPDSRRPCCPGRRR